MSGFNNKAFSFVAQERVCYSAHDLEKAADSTECVACGNSPTATVVGNADSPLARRQGFRI